MTAAEQISDSETLTVQIPLRLRKRGGRKLMIVPEGATAWAPQRARVDSAVVKAIARAHRWRRMVESGDYASVTELAAAEKINQSYACAANGVSAGLGVMPRGYALRRRVSDGRGASVGGGETSGSAAPGIGRRTR